jgi:hypothetical protein
MSDSLEHKIISGMEQFAKDHLIALNPLNCFYEHRGGHYWIPDINGNWIRVNERVANSHLAAQSTKENPISIIQIITNHSIDYAGPLAGFPAGPLAFHNHTILVTESPAAVEPRRGSFPTILALMHGMFGLQGPQLHVMYSWIKVFYESLRANRLRPGQAVVLAGPVQSGKSLLQNYVLTPLFGGRQANPYSFMSGGTDFNAHLFCAEHLVIEDEAASRDLRTRRDFGSKIKQVAATDTGECHQKGRTPIVLPRFQRLSISCNDEPENLLVLPPLDESIKGKLILFKVERNKSAFPGPTDAQRAAFLRTIQSELPAFAADLLEYEIPPSLADDRYGVAHFHHPDILNELGALQPETELVEFIDEELFGGPSGDTKVWEGSVTKLMGQLEGLNSSVRQQAIDFFRAKGSRVVGAYLGRLAKSYPERFSYKHTRKGGIWTISAP